MSHLIEFKDFSVYYKQKKDYVVAVDEVTFEVDEGEFLVLAGPSGCGKTTILKSMMGAVEHTSGEIRSGARACQTPIKQTARSPMSHRNTACIRP